MIERRDLRVAVDDVAPAGVDTVGVRAVIDVDRLGDPPVVLCCFPGGGMSSWYFELDGFDMAGHLVAAGFAVVLIDHPGVGASDVPDDPWALVPEVVADIDAAAADRVVASLDLDGSRRIGVGHSMGAMLVAYQHARWQLYAGLVLIGYSGRGLPEILEPEEVAVAGDADKIRASIVALSRARFGRPLPAGGTSTSEMLVGPTPPDDATTAIAASGGALLAMCGLTSMIPGSHTAELTAIDVPVLLAIAENDIVGPPHEVPGYFPGSSDVTLHVVRQAFHNSNIAPTRQALWDRIATWARTLPEAFPTPQR